MKVLVTGSAGPIGFHLAKPHCERGDTVVGFDSINEYYDVAVKHGRLRRLGSNNEGILRKEPNLIVACIQT